MWWWASLLHLLVLRHVIAQDTSLRSEFDPDEMLLESLEVISFRVRNGPPAPAICTTPNGKKGVCDLVSRCPIYLPLISQLVNDVVTQFFRSRVCRTLPQAIHICCPENEAVTQPGATGRPQLPIRPPVTPGSIPRPTQRPNGRKPGSLIPSFPQVSQNVPVRGQRPSQDSSVPGVSDKRPQLQPQPPQLQPQPPQLQPQRPPQSSRPQQQRPSLAPPKLPSLNPQLLPPSQQVLPKPPRVSLPTESECGQLRLGDQTAAEWPWVVVVGVGGVGGGQRCVGILISSAHVLAPAHCLSHSSSTQVWVRGQAVPVFNYTDPGYNPATRRHDIAVVTLATPLTFSDQVQPACLPLRYKYDGFRYQSLTQVFVTPPGDSRGGGSGAVVKERLVEVVGIEECSNTLPPSLFPNPSSIMSRRHLCGSSISSTTLSCTDAAGSSLIFHDEENTRLYSVVGVGSLPHSCTPQPSLAIPNSPQPPQALLLRPQTSPALLNNPQPSVFPSNISQPSQTISSGQLSPALYTRVGAYLDWITQQIQS